MKINELKDNSIVICPQAEAKRLIALKSNKAPELNIKFLDKTELLKGVYFDFDLEAVDYVSKTYGYSLENAKEIIRNSYNVSNLTKKTEKVALIKEDLVKKNLLETNPRFKHLFDNKEVLVSGYSEDDKELKHALDLLNVKATYIKEDQANVKREVIAFENMDEEVLYVIEKIYGLLESDVDLNDIFIYEPDAEYIPLLKKYSVLFNLPIELPNDNKLIDSPIFEKFVELLKEHEVEEAYDLLVKDSKEDTYGAMSSLTTAINRCAFSLSDKDNFVKLLKFTAKGMSLRPITYDHSIKMCDSSFRTEPNQHIFVLGFSLGSFPHVSLDNDFYSDKEKESLYINDSKTKSEIEKKALIAFLNLNSNICLTRKKKFENTAYFKSLLVEELGYGEEIKGKLPSIIHSKKVAEILVSKAKDDLRLYNLDSEYVDTFTKDEIGYKSYDHSFKKVGSYVLPKELKLSYTSINEFNKCPFEYYLKRVLKLNTFESSFFSNLGELFHKVLEDSEKDDKEVNLSDYDGFVKENFVTEKDKFFISILLPKALEVIKKNKEFEKQSKFNRVETEKNYEIDIEPGVKMVGKIDKVLYDDEGKNLAVVDYKTSAFKYSDSDASHGIDMQLPIYGYLLGENIPEYRTVGLYIQNVLFDPLKNAQSDRDLIPYILNGITLSDVDAAKRIDTKVGVELDSEGNVINESQFVRNIPLTPKGKLNTRGGTIMDSGKLATRIDTTEKLIRITLNDIKAGNFDIRPISDNVNDGPCAFCGCQDICFKKGYDAMSSKEYNAKIDQILEEMNAEEGENEDESR